MKVTAIPMRTVSLPSGEAIPVLGQGTWTMGEDPAKRQQEVAALRAGLDHGLHLIDTAEMYGGGATEELVREAIRGRRDEVFLVTKVMPQRATRRGTVLACEESLRRLGTDRIDLYLLHWPGAVPLAETLEGFEVLLNTGRIRHWGVSNFDVSDMEDLVALPRERRQPGHSVQTDQVLYNLIRRGIEYDLLPWCQRHGVPIMAYSPVEQGRLLRKPRLHRVATRHNATPAQIALAWVLRTPDVCAIPKAGTPAHVLENRAALDIVLTSEDLEELDQAFPAPTASRPLEVI
ncbi:MAG: aldo/keto reductase [Pseudomonadota bacterium]|nr:aldo/keto reductase [Pseudomonadota bacterium]